MKYYKLLADDEFVGVPDIARLLDISAKEVLYLARPEGVIHALLRDVRIDLEWQCPDNTNGQIVPSDIFSSEEPVFQKICYFLIGDEYILRLINNEHISEPIIYGMAEIVTNQKKEKREVVCGPYHASGALDITKIPIIEEKISTVNHKEIKVLTCIPDNQSNHLEITIESVYIKKSDVIRLEKKIKQHENSKTNRPESDSKRHNTLLKIIGALIVTEYGEKIYWKNDNFPNSPNCTISPNSPNSNKIAEQMVNNIKNKNYSLKGIDDRTLRKIIPLAIEEIKDNFQSPTKREN